MNVAPYTDRRAAGRELAKRLRAYADRPEVIVLALPRGGVPVGYEVARALDAPLDVLVVRKLGVPGHEELGFGAVASGGVRILNAEIVGSLDIAPRTIEQVTESETRELERRSRAYRGERSQPELARRVAILVDDGLATGSTMRVAIEAVRSQGPRRIVVAVPVAPHETCEELRLNADEVVCPMTPAPFDAIGLWYADFRPTTDHEVRQLLAAAERGQGEPERALERAVEIPADDVALNGDLAVPAGARGVVVFAHGSGSGRRSPRNRLVAHELQRAGLGTLLVDLLTEREAEIDEQTRELRFDIGLLARRLTAAIAWSATIGRRSSAATAETPELPVGIYGASTGAAASLMAAVNSALDVRAIVSRGGRPDLAASALPEVRAPTLLIVGGADPEVLELNRRALDLLRAEKRLEIVEGATHLFEEPGALQRVAGLARDWFIRHLSPALPVDEVVLRDPAALE